MEEKINWRRKKRKGRISKTFSVECDKKAENYTDQWINALVGRDGGRRVIAVGRGILGQGMVFGRLQPDRGWRKC